jgi:hypothetical protein
VNNLYKTMEHPETEREEEIIVITCRARVSVLVNVIVLGEVIK